MSEPCWHELATPDVEGAMRFYGGLFGWEAGQGSVGFPYQFLRRPGEAKNFGGATAPPQGAPPHWLVYFAVPDLDAALEKVAALGGRVHVSPVKLPQGRFAVVADPQGASFALFQG
ncbi:MAG: VOC family protein [Gemmataceae bacterium]